MPLRRSRPLSHHGPLHTDKVTVNKIEVRWIKFPYEKLMMISDRGLLHNDVTETDAYMHPERERERERERGGGGGGGKSKTLASYREEDVFGCLTVKYGDAEEICRSHIFSHER